MQVYMLQKYARDFIFYKGKVGKKEKEWKTKEIVLMDSKVLIKPAMVTRMLINMKCKYDLGITWRWSPALECNERGSTAL